MAGRIWFRQALDLPASVGIGLLVAGAVALNVFSKSVSHGRKGRVSPV